MPVRTPTPAELEDLLRRAMDTRAPATLRLEGSNRILGDLRIAGMRSGLDLRVAGAKRRDALPPAGTKAALSLVVGEEVLSAPTQFMEPQASDADEPGLGPVLRLRWPGPEIAFHHRAGIRVAAPSQTPLKAELEANGGVWQARIMNLTETGLGLGLAATLPLEAFSIVEVRTELPGAGPLRAVAEVRHVTLLDDEALPTRIGLVVKDAAPEDLDALYRFVQMRRADRSETMRAEGGDGSGMGAEA
jgi:hypothetical protein